MTGKIVTAIGCRAVSDCQVFNVIKLIDYGPGQIVVGETKVTESIMRTGMTHHADLSREVMLRATVKVAGCIETLLLARGQQTDCILPRDSWAEGILLTTLMA
jgi:hypothetical protein